MDGWVVVLLIAVMAGIMGWFMTFVVNGVLWFCDWREGTPINWGLEVAYSIAVPFAWIFSLLEVYLLYSKT